MDAAKTIRALLAKMEMPVLPGAHDCLSGKMARDAGAEALYLGSFACNAARFGMPDAGLIPVSQLIDHYRDVIEAAQLPTICDLDDGGGSALRIAYNVRLARQAGIAGFHIEDIDLSRGKYLPGLGKNLIPVERMVDHIHAALDAREGSDMLVIARTDAMDGFSLEEALDRVSAYEEAGADMVMLPHLAIDQLAAVRARVACGIVHLFTMSDLRDSADLDRAKAAGANLMIYPGISIWAAAHAMRTAYEALLKDGHDATQPYGGETLQKIFDVVGANSWSRFAR